jgi:hypothetical protein
MHDFSSLYMYKMQKCLCSLWWIVLADILACLLASRVWVTSLLLTSSLIFWMHVLSVLYVNAVYMQVNRVYVQS